MKGPRISTGEIEVTLPSSDYWHVIDKIAGVGVFGWVGNLFVSILFSTL
jgi:hypothetical protein